MSRFSHFFSFYYNYVENYCSSCIFVMKTCSSLDGNLFAISRDNVALNLPDYWYLLKLLTKITNIGSQPVSCISWLIINLDSCLIIIPRTHNWSQFFKSNSIIPNNFKLKRFVFKISFECYFSLYNKRIKINYMK